GKDVVQFYHGEKAGEAAAAEWHHRFSERQDPTEIPVVEIRRSDLTDGKMPIYKLVAACGLAKSNNEARQHVKWGAVTIGPERQKITDPVAYVVVTDGLIVRVGNRKVVRIRLV